MGVCEGLKEMKVTRRKFVSSASACAGGILLGRLGEFSIGDSRLQRECAVLDLRGQCALRESLEGYASVAGKGSVCVLGEARNRARGSRITIVPGVGVLDQPTASALAGVARAGGALLLESGAGFLERCDFAAHQKMLQGLFNVVIDEPVDAWAEGEAMPYIRYAWPAERAVRDFSRVVPVLAEDSQVIGRLRGLAVAAKEGFGRGKLIFLGSPLGPALRAGDAEACQWLQALSSTI